jgi:DHA2 family multidrug resistance protein
MWSLNSLTGLMQLDQMVNLQASMIAYLDDFMLMTIVCLMALPLVPLLRPVRHKPIEEGDTPSAAALD